MASELLLDRRKHLIAKKEDELQNIERSRKRKLRELYAVASHSESGIPSFVQIDANINEASIEERKFLEGNDVRKFPTFNIATIPPRKLRYAPSSARASSTATTAQSVADKTERNQVAFSDLLKTQRENREMLQERAKTDAQLQFGPGRYGGSLNSPVNALSGAVNGSAKVNVQPVPPATAQTLNQTQPQPQTAARTPAVAPIATPAPTSLSAPTPTAQKQITPTQLLDLAVDKSIANAEAAAKMGLTPSKPTPIPPNTLERERIVNRVENTPPADTGVNPNIAIPPTAEDAANLPGPIINGANDPNHSPATVHLPPREVQEQRLREQDERAKKAREEKKAVDTTSKLKLDITPAVTTNGKGHHDSSRGSTEAPLSATTSNNAHDSSADTSPENEQHNYDPDAMDVDKTESESKDPSTPPELAATEEEKKEKEAHDRRLAAQIELVRERILESSPVSAEAQLLQEQAASATPDTKRSEESVKLPSPAPAETNGQKPVEHALQGDETAGEIMDDEKADEEEMKAAAEANGTAGVAAPVVVEKSPVEAPPQPQQERRVTLAVDADGRPSEAPEKSPREISPGTKVTATTDNKDPAQVTDGAKIAMAVPPPVLKQTPAPTPPAPERMTTRVGSGAMRLKSVSEIVGDTPRNGSASGSDRSRSRTGTPSTPVSKLNRLAEKAREKERSKLSTVVFAKPTPSAEKNAVTAAPGKAMAPSEEVPDYFLPLIQQQAYTSKGFQPLDQLISQAHKTITTSNAQIPFLENQAQKIIRRIHNLQSTEKWSLRQPKRVPEPNRPATHWDELLKEVKWMRTDFREERKWKMAFAKRVASECELWVNSAPEQRQLLQRKVKIPKPADEQTEAAETDVEMPDLEPGDNGSPIDEFDDEPSISHLDVVPPTAIFSLDNDDLVFALNKTQASDKLLQELPIYGQPLQVHRNELPTSDFDPDAHWKKPYLPLSKYIEGKIVLKDDPPPRKKSRFEYDSESEEEDGVVFGMTAEEKKKDFAPRDTEVALFNPENRHLRERIHAGHQFRPPSEFQMPTQSFFENRMSSQWTLAEDDYLKELVRAYQYNWSLIANMMAPKSLFTSAAERRTPWECFERWITLEGLPADMVKTHYFRAYNNRMDAARRSLAQQAQLQAAQQALPNGNAAANPLRQIRRTTDTQRVERRRNAKHITLIDAMRKVAKKRETAQQKQQHAQNQATVRKQSENAQPATNGVKHTPAQISKLKHERELALQERIARAGAIQEQQRRQAQAALRNPQNPQGFPMVGPNGQPLPRNMGMAAPGNRNLAVPGVPNHLPHVPMQSLKPPTVAGQMGMPMQHGGMGQMQPNGVPQAQMQGMQNMQGMQHSQQGRLPVPNQTPDLNLVMQAQRISQQQRAAVQMQQNGQHATGQAQMSPQNAMRPNPQGMAGGANVHPTPAQQQTFLANAANLAAQTAMHNFTNSPNHPQPPPNQMSPGAGRPAGSPAVQAIEQGFRTKYPQATEQQIRKLVGDALLQQERVRAMQAAAGGQGNMGSPAMGNANPAMGNVGVNVNTGMAGGMSGGLANGLSQGLGNSPVQYAQMLRAQQERQAQIVAQAAQQQQQQQQANMGQGQGQNQGQNQGQTGSQGPGPSPLGQNAGVNRMSQGPQNSPRPGTAGMQAPPQNSPRVQSGQPMNSPRPMSQGQNQQQQQQSMQQQQQGQPSAMQQAQQAAQNAANAQAQAQANANANANAQAQAQAQARMSPQMQQVQQNAQVQQQQHAQAAQQASQAVQGQVGAQQAAQNAANAQAQQRAASAQSGQAQGMNGQAQGGQAQGQGGQK